MASDPIPRAVPTSDPTHLARIGRGRLPSLAAAALLSALVALVPTVLLLEVQQRNLDTLENRLRGHRYLLAVAPLTSALPWHRDLSTRLLLGDASVEGALRRAAGEVRSALRQGGATTAQHGDALGLSAAWQDLAERWALLESRYSRLTAPDNVEAHDRLLEHAAEFLALIGQRSQLLVEPAAGARALILCESVGMPRLARQIAALRAQALLASSHPGPEGHERIVRTLADARVALGRLGLELESAYAADGASRALLERRSAHALALARRVLEQAGAAAESGQRDELDPSVWFSATTQAVESLQGVQDILSERVAAVLTGQAEALRVRRRATQALVALVGCCALLGLLVLGRSLLRPRGQADADASSPPTGERTADRPQRWVDPLA